ncbi:hypothetical protein [Nitrosovibrio sp. Nv6]|uniref:hypothetical protein n=1 Tax=Nitrosovibrio sp. Nv6 TaxID=1855340 RepID=UPI00115FD33F|nr:hypothetical protein [Nitrosovibrio sp. Nv6]
MSDIPCGDPPVMLVSQENGQEIGNDALFFFFGGKYPVEMSASRAQCENICQTKPNRPRIILSELRHAFSIRAVGQGLLHRFCYIILIGCKPSFLTPSEKEAHCIAKVAPGWR